MLTDMNVFLIYGQRCAAGLPWLTVLVFALIYFQQQNQQRDWQQQIQQQQQQLTDWQSWLKKQKQIETKLDKHISLTWLAEQLHCWRQWQTAHRIQFQHMHWTAETTSIHAWAATASALSDLQPRFGHLHMHKTAGKPLAWRWLQPSHSPSPIPCLEQTAHAP